MPLDGTSYRPRRRRYLKEIMILDQMLKLLENRRNWGRGQWERRTWLLNRRVLCIEGALGVAAIGHASFEYREDVTPELTSVLNELKAHVPHGHPLRWFNDSYKTAHADIIRLICDTRATFVMSDIAAVLENRLNAQEFN